MIGVWRSCSGVGRPSAFSRRDLPIQYAIQHHPSRAHLLPALLAALPDAQVIQDPGAHESRRSPWRAYQACLHALEADADSLCILQDDSEPCLDFGETLGLVVARHPTVPVALFVPGVGMHRRKILDACARDSRYAELPYRNTFVPAVAVVWPRACVESILAWAATHPSDRTADDGVLGAWAEASGTRVLATVPSLVEHPDRERSLVGKTALQGRNPARCAACYIGDMSPLELDW